MPRRRRPPRAGALTDLPPLKILTQMIILQAIYYLSAAILILFTVLVAGQKFSLDLIFDWRSVRGDTTVGWMLGLVWMLNSLISVISLLLVVSRSKLIPDFALTIHLLHLIATCLYSSTGSSGGSGGSGGGGASLPTNVFWWMLQAASAALMTSLGVWACRWRELRPINFGGGGGNRSRTTGGVGGGGGGEEEGSGTADDNDMEEGYADGGRRNRTTVHGRIGGGGGGGTRTGVVVGGGGAERGDYELMALKHDGGADDADGDV